METWDLYDKDFNKLPKTAVRGEKLADDEFHLVVNAWIKNDKGEFLISQRVESKPHPLLWECTGGSAVAGDTDIVACVREIKEELGIDIDTKTCKFIGQAHRFYEGCNDILRVYLFFDNTPIEDVVIQKEEVNDAMWADKQTIYNLINENKFLVNPFLTEILEGENWRNDETG